MWSMDKSQFVITWGWVNGDISLIFFSELVLYLQLYPNLLPCIKMHDSSVSMSILFWNFSYLLPHPSQKFSRNFLHSSNIFCLSSLFLMPVCWVLSVRWRMYECVRERCEAHGIVSVWACVFACICVADTHKVKATLEVICKATQPGMLH